MKTSWLVAILLLFIIIGGGWYFLSNKTEKIAVAPSGAMGINGSANQGNMGGANTGVVQQPLADGAEGKIIGANLALGIVSNEVLREDYLIGYNGMTVYTFDQDPIGKSTCIGICAENWPPYLVGPADNVAQLQAGVTGKTATIVRQDGTIQMTYNGRPLYFYLKDKTSGDTLGNGAGGNWHIVKP